MAAPKREKFFDCDNDAEVVCLSSDTDDDTDGMTNGARVNGRDKPRTLMDMGFKPQLSSSGGMGAIKNGHNSGRSNSVITSSAEVKRSRNTDCSPEGGGGADDVEIMTLGDDSEGFEIEYPRNDMSGGPQKILDIDSDDDIQVLEDAGCSFRTKKRPSQESGRKEVNLSLPGLNLGLISGGGGSRMSNQNKTVFIDGNEESSSQEILGLLNPIDTEVDNDVEVIEEEPTEESVSGASMRPFRGFGSVRKIDYREESRRALQRFINEFCARNSRVKKTKLEIAKKKALDAYEEIKHFHEPIHIRLKEEIENATEVIRCTDMTWKTLRNLLDLMSPKIVGTLDDKPEEERKKEKEQKKVEMRHKYEKLLAKTQMQIKKLEETEVEWDDENEHNSPYVLADKYKSKLVRAYYTLCDLSGCNRLTGRPTQVKINLRKHNGGTNYDVIDAEVEKFVNKGGFLFAPDYTDILEIITKVDQREGLGFTQNEILKTAQQMFENVMKIIKKRREKDFKISMLALLPKPGSSATASESASSSSIPPVEENDDLEETSLDKFEDPADLDEELKAKLEENEKLKKSESEVIDRFCKLAEEAGHQPAEVNDDNADASPPPSDNEEEEYDDEEDDVKVSNEHEHAELTEDEDEVPETVTSGWEGPLNPDDSDEDSNEGKTESESDVNLDTAEDSNGVDNNDTKSETLVESEVRTVVSDMVKETEEKDDEVQPPPAKRMRPDENFNEDRSNMMDAEETKAIEVGATVSSDESSQHKN